VQVEGEERVRVVMGSSKKQVKEDFIKRHPGYVGKRIVIRKGLFK
jgi:hypothetical protein